jgi:hypothetical protein
MIRPGPRFDHQPIRLKGRLLLKSICARCGQSKVVSAADETLAAWEEGHICQGANRSPAQSLPATEKQNALRPENR